MLNGCSVRKWIKISHLVNITMSGYATPNVLDWNIIRLERINDGNFVLV